MSHLAKAIELVHDFKRGDEHNPCINDIYDECFEALCEALSIGDRSSEDPWSRFIDHWEVDDSPRVEIEQFSFDLKRRLERLVEKEKESVGEDHYRRVGDYFDLLSEWMLRLCEIDHVEVSPLRPYARQMATALNEGASLLRVEALEDSGENLPQDWPPLVSQKPSTSPVKSYKAWRTDNSLRKLLSNDPRERSLVVLLGPGVVQAKATWVEEIENVTSTFDDAEQSDRDFFEELVASREHNRVVGRSDGSGPVELDDLRRALVSAARLATELLSKSSNPNTPINDWNRYATQLEAPEAKDLVAALKKASQMAKKLSANDAGADLQLLGAKALAVRLNHLAGEVVRSKPHRIMGTEVNWLTDCAWHSLIFRSALYPEVRELALQIDLCSGDDTTTGPVRRLDPGEAIARGTLTSITNHAARAVLRGFRHGHTSPALRDPRAPTRDDFYEAVARRLWYEQDRGLARPTSPPLAVSMTFDLELERALCSTQEDRPFHVLVPVLRPVGGEEMVLRWLLGTYEKQDANRLADGDEGVDPAEVTPLLGYLRTPRWSVADEVPSGPVVVKLNGSPLHRLPIFVGPEPIDRPTALMEKISRWLEEQHRPAKRNAIEAQEFGRAEDVRRALETLTNELFILETKKGNAREYTSNRAYREALRGTQSLPTLHALLLPELDAMDIGVVSLVANATRRTAGDTPTKKVPFRQAMPDWLRASVATQSSNLWLVIGARWHDWSSRSQIFNMLSWPSESSDRRALERVVAVSKEIDVDRINPLHWLWVQFVTGDCLDLIRDLREVTKT